MASDIITFEVELIPGFTTELKAVDSYFAKTGHHDVVNGGYEPGGIWITDGIKLNNKNLVRIGELFFSHKLRGAVVEGYNPGGIIYKADGYYVCDEEDSQFVSWEQTDKWKPRPIRR